MADIGSSAALLSDEERKKRAEESQAGGFVSGGQIGGGSNVVGNGGGVSTAGVGAGGTGGWTNIQAYLNANKQDTGTADYLDAKVSDQLKKESDNLMSQSSEIKAKGQEQANKVLAEKEKANDTISQAADAYKWENPADETYQQKLTGLNDAIYGQYSGPKNFQYGISDDTQKYKTSLGNNDAFSEFLNDSYRDRSGRSMSSGQLSLQRQLDTTNDRLAQTRQNLLQQYAGLEGTRDQVVKDTDAALGKAEQDYRVNQNAILDFLRGNLNENETEIGKKENQSKFDYNNSYNTEKSGIGSYKSPGFSTSLGGVTTDNATWEELQRQYDAAPWAHTYNPYDRGELDDYLYGTKQALDNFYKTQDEKYQSTADTEKRKWNVISDLLKSQAERKKQGFKVRGG